MTSTLLLGDSWDISLDAAGHIATTQGSYAVAQRVANAVRLFTQDAYFAQAEGIPHFGIELGQLPPAAVIIDRINRAARSVPEVATASTVLTRLEARTMTGTITITTTSGEVIHVRF